MTFAGEEVDERAIGRDAPSSGDEGPREGAQKTKAGTFAGMGLLPELVAAVRKRGYRLPTPIQRKCIPALLAGRDVVGMARTGSGKTAAFLLPLVQRLRAHSARVGARALVLSPSRELALQTHGVLRELLRASDSSLRTALVVGGDAIDEQFAALAANPDVLIACPGRLVHVAAETGLSLRAVEYVVWDEADRMMEDAAMAAQLVEVTARLGASRQTALFSATLPRALADFAAAGLRDPLLVRLDAEAALSPDLRTVELLVQPGAPKDALLLLVLERLSSSSECARTVVFAATRHHVEYVAEMLCALGVRASAVHGGMDMDARRAAVDALRRGKTPVLVVTDVAARGIDVPLLDAVVNYDFPPSPKTFVHRVGRVARAGRAGTAYSFVTPEDAPHLVDLRLFLGAGLGGLASVPRSLLDDAAGRIAARTTAGLEALAGVAANAARAYRRTRPAASPASHERARELLAAAGGGAGTLLPACAELLPAGSDFGGAQAALLAGIHAYRPRDRRHAVLGATPAMAEALERAKARRSNSASAGADAGPKGAHGRRAVDGQPLANAASPHTGHVIGKSGHGKRSADIADVVVEKAPSFRVPSTSEALGRSAAVDAGYALRAGKSFADAARAAVSETSLAPDDDPAAAKRARRTRRDVPLVDTGFGTRLPASFRTDAYAKWRAKTRLAIQAPGEAEDAAGAARAAAMLDGRAEARRWRTHRLRRSALRKK